MAYSNNTDKSLRVCSLKMKKIETICRDESRKAECLLNFDRKRCLIFSQASCLFALLKECLCLTNEPHFICAYVVPEEGGGQSSFGCGGQAVPLKRVTLPVFAEAGRPSLFAHVSEFHFTAGS